MTILVTGGTGFIGLPILRNLTDEGEKPVVYDLMPNLNQIEDISRKIEVVRGNILDLPHLMRTIKEYDVDKVIHLVYFGDAASRKHPYGAVENSLLGTTNMFEAARILDLEKVVWASSGAVYGPAAYYGGKNVAMDEEKPTKPNGMYGACKVFNEFTGQFYCSEYGLDIIALRLTSVYGAGRHHSAYYTGEIIEDPARGKRVRVPLSSAEEHDFVYVKDVASAFMLALRAKRPEHNIFNVSGGTYTLQDIADCVKEILPGAVIEFEDRPLVGRVSRFSIDRARKDLGFERQYSLKTGIRDMIQIVKSKK